MRKFRAGYKINIRDNPNLSANVIGTIQRGDNFQTEYLNPKSADGHVWARLVGAGWCAISNGVNAYAVEIARPKQPLG